MHTSLLGTTGSDFAAIKVDQDSANTESGATACPFIQNGSSGEDHASGAYQDLTVNRIDGTELSNR